MNPPTRDCTINDSLFADITTTLTEVETVIRVTWVTAETATVYASYIIADDEESVAQTSSDSTNTVHDLLLRGLAPNETYAVQ